MNNDSSVLIPFIGGTQGLYSLSRPTSYGKISKFWSREIVCCDDHIVLELDRHLSSAAAEISVKFQNDWKSLNSNLAASRLQEILV